MRLPNDPNPLGRRVWPIIAAVTALAVVGCSKPMQVNTQVSPTASFTGLNTYAWFEKPAPTATPGVQNEAVGWRVQDAVDLALEDRGYRRAIEEESPDFQVAYFATAWDMVEFSTVNNYWGYQVDWYAAGGFVQVYRQGTLVIDIVDPKSNELLWRGSASGAVSNSSDQEMARTIREAVYLIFESFPPDQ